MEKYLNDTISKASQAEYETYSKTNKMPKHLKRLQYKEDSIRARKWFEMTKDSSYINKYTRVGPVKNPAKKKETPDKNNQPALLAVLPNEKIYKQRPRVFTIS